jgi:hypothetical protein
MTQAQNQSNVVVPESFDDRARFYLEPADYDLLSKYMSDGKHALAVSTAVQFFELFLNGSSVQEIHNLNKTFPYESILWARIRDRWDEQKQDYLNRLQDGIKERLLKAKLETVGLMSDMLAVVSKREGEKLRKYIQTGNEEHLKGAIQLNSVQAIQKAVETIEKITGEDKKIRITKEEKLDVSVTAGISAADGSTDSMSPEAAAKILEIVAAEKRKKAADGK